MDPSCLESAVQAGGGGIMVWGIFSRHALGPLIQSVKHRLNAAACPSIVADHVRPFMTTLYPDSFVQQDIALCAKAQIIRDVQLTNLDQRSQRQF